MAYIAIGIRRKRNNQVLDVHYPIILQGHDTIQKIFNGLNLTKEPVIGLSDEQYEYCRDLFFVSLPSHPTFKSWYATTDFVLTTITDLSAPIESTEDAYFRLQLLSQRLVKPHGQNLDGIFGHLPNIAWSSIGPVLPDDVPMVQLKLQQDGHALGVTHVDKFPYMTQYHMPSGVRIADASRVRLGAYLGEGTTIMPAGFVNFNAGTLGNAMVEGRISAGVVVGEDSDIGGGASIMGTLSGGNNHVISIGKNCLLGANAGVGISLGDGCSVGAGVYVTAGKKVGLFDEQNQPVNHNNEPVKAGENIVKASTLSGASYRLFFEDSTTGQLICKPNTKVIQLNTALHINS